MAYWASRSRPGLGRGGQEAAATGLDHLKNDYRRRFCRPARVPDIHIDQGQNMLELLQDCFEEKSPGISDEKHGIMEISLINDLITNSTESLLCSPKIKESYIQSPGKECHTSTPKSLPGSSRRKAPSLQGTAQASEAASGSAQANEVHRKILAIDVGSKSTPDSKKMSNQKLNVCHSEDGHEFYLSVGSPAVLLDAKASVSQNTIPSVDQKRGMSISKNSVNIQSSSTEISLRTKKRLNFEDKDISNNVEIEHDILEIEDKLLEGKERVSSQTSQKRVRDLEYELHPQAKKSFSALFLETVRRKGESSPIIRHTATVTPLSCPPNDMKLSENEFVIDESDGNFSSQSWVTIPRKGEHLKHHTTPPAESTVILQDKKSRRKHHNVSPETLTGNKGEKSNIQRNKEESKKNRFSSRSKSTLVPEEVTMTVMKSHRISRRPSDWWVVKSEESAVDKNSSIKNDLSVRPKSIQKPAKKTNQSSKNTRKKPPPSKRHKKAVRRSKRVQENLNIKYSGGTLADHNEISGSQCEPLESDKTGLAQKRKLDYSGTTGYSKDQNSVVIAQDVHIRQHSSEYTCMTPVQSNLDSGKPNISVLEESGPSRMKNHVMSGNNNFDIDNEDVWERLDDSKIKRSKVSPDTKIHQKIVLPSNTPNVRRTKRIRLKPLEYWRGERVDYQERQSGGFVIRGILSPALVSPKKKEKGNLDRVNKRNNKKGTCLENLEREDRLVVNLDIPLGDPLQPTPVKDPETKNIILMDLIKPRDTYQFFIEHGNLKVYKTLDTPFFSTGKLVLGPYEEKGKQYVGQDILIFYVNFGDLLCTLHETPYIITTGDSFYVPSGNYYNIKNLLNKESIILFTQIKR